jgi:hypothetical protein
MQQQQQLSQSISPSNADIVTTTARTATTAQHILVFLLCLRFFRITTFDPKNISLIFSTGHPRQTSEKNVALQLKWQQLPPPPPPAPLANRYDKLCTKTYFGLQGGDSQNFFCKFVIFFLT